MPGWAPSGPPPKRGRGKLALIVGAVVAALVLVGAATTALVLNHRADVAAAEREAAAARKAQAEREAAAEAKREAEAQKQAELEAARAQYTACTDQLGPLLRVLDNVDSRLDVGLSQRDLSNMIGKASIAYHRIDIKALGQGPCLAAGAKLESAFNAYNVTVSDWNDCIYDLYCDVDNDVLPGMQRRWAQASNLISRAEKVMDTINPDSVNYRAGSGDNT